MRVRSVFSGALVCAFAVTSANAQIVDLDSWPHDLPDGPATPGFDIDRFSNSGNGWFETFHVEQIRPLHDVLAAGEVVSDTRLLVLETVAGPLALLIDQMGYHHIAQGQVDGKDWMATF